ncbi:hypothetical protein [Neorhizobium sp. DAR64860/K0K1]|uniref:hypothetical protein n=1 Tax=Neorhizobium sp. DAR64860/K0K1 TaxID=3421955 RepID=UPI003D2B631A
MGENGLPAAAAAAAAALPASDAAKAKLDDPALWMIESFVLAQNEVYTPLIGDAAGPYGLTTDYEAQAVTVARSQAALAGERLAAILNAWLSTAPIDIEKNRYDPALLAWSKTLSFNGAEGHNGRISGFKFPGPGQLGGGEVSVSSTYERLQTTAPAFKTFAHPIPMPRPSPLATPAVPPGHLGLAGSSQDPSVSNTEISPFGATGNRATRLFAGLGEYPPKIYAAYGIVAFWDRIDPAERDRYTAICLAYLRSLDLAPAGMAAEKQMVTVWPVTSGTAAKGLMSGSSFQTFDMISQCESVLNNYDFQVGREAIRMARLQSKDVDGRGPFLLAWSPTDKIGTDKAIILMADLSETDNFFAARDIFRIWIKEIESDLDLWNDGFTWDRLQRKLKALVDKYGGKIEAAFKAKQ